jgi:hypothetical protein
MLWSTFGAGLGPPAILSTKICTPLSKTTAPIVLVVMYDRFGFDLSKLFGALSNFFHSPSIFLRTSGPPQGYQWRHEDHDRVAAADRYRNRAL